ncbi:MAG: DNA-binding response regulator [Armatimonadetes bacterium RBG_16_67_12]|nr:MAG: DNA-binding response regulator [Armatimonadetes bacterium RBG_16_67_12]
MKILIVEDEETMVTSLRALLSREGYQVVAARDGLEGVEAARTTRPDLILLDLALPGLDGLEVCRRVRLFSTAPVIMLTARASEGDKVTGLDLGADDYVTKPFSPKELIARVKAQLRRVQTYTQADQQDVLQIGEVALDVPARRVTVRGREVALSPKEFELLRVFMANGGRVLGRDYLLDRVWGEDYAGDVRTLDVHVRWLREKIERDPSAPKHVQTVHGVGYRFQ